MAEEQNANTQNESINIDNETLPVYRMDEPTPYIAFTAPAGAAYIMAPEKMKPEEIVQFVQANVAAYKEVQQLVIKRHKKGKQKGTPAKCAYMTGDIVYLFGRPFVLRVQPIENKQRVRKGTHGRASVISNMYQSVSVIQLSVLQSGNFDQRKQAFLSYANPVFLMNAESLIGQCQDKLRTAITTRALDQNPEDTAPPLTFPPAVKARPMRNANISIDNNNGIVWVSESLLPFPWHCLIYEYARAQLSALEQDYKVVRDNFEDILLEVCPSAQNAREILSNKDSVFYKQ